MLCRGGLKIHGSFSGLKKCVQAMDLKPGGGGRNWSCPRMQKYNGCTTWRMSLGVDLSFVSG